MKIIVGGAGSVGQSIVGYLAQGSNDIIVVDNDQKNSTNCLRLPMSGLSAVRFLTPAYWKSRRQKF